MLALVGCCVSLLLMGTDDSMVNFQRICAGAVSVAYLHKAMNGADDG